MLPSHCCTEAGGQVARSLSTRPRVGGQMGKVYFLNERGYSYCLFHPHSHVFFFLISRRPFFWVLFDRETEHELGELQAEAEGEAGPLNVT